MRIDPDKTPIKYILGTEKDNEAYPNATDVIWSVVNNAIREGGKTADVFTMNTLIKYRFKGENIDRIQHSVQHLIELGIIEPIKQPGAKEAYKILINPFE